MSCYIKTTYRRRTLQSVTKGRLNGSERRVLRSQHIALVWKQQLWAFLAAAAEGHHIAILQTSCAISGLQLMSVVSRHLGQQTPIKKVKIIYPMAYCTGEPLNHIF
jgi:hypothetical protein